MESAQDNEVAVVIFLSVGMTVLALLAGAIILFFLIYQKRMLQQKLAFSELEAAHKEALLHGNIEQVEEERKRIAKDLHDEVGSIFSTLKLKINQLDLQGADPGIIQLLSGAQDVIDTGMASVRRISHGITPPGLEMFGLPDAVEALCDSMTGPGLSVNFASPPDFPRLSPKYELGLYRIAQELLNNAAKHAAATSIDVSLERSGNAIALAYLDNGKGFDPALLKARKGLGIRNVEARASQLNAAVEWTTQPGQGLKTVITIPDWQNS